MRILDFGPESGHAITAFGSRATLAPLMRRTDVARTVVMHLPPHGVVGTHEAGTHQLFCVMSGEGWVAGSDDVRRSIQSFQAAEWQPGELHTSGTDTGMVAIVIEGDFEVELPEL
jgi:hypothetical protein